MVISGGSTAVQHMILFLWSIGEGTVIRGVAVKCVDMRKNTCGEGGLLDDN